MLEVVGQLFRFFRVYRKFWLAPVIVGLLCLGILLIAAQSTAIAPFIYAIF
jgi:hypothetical protein